VGSHLFTDLEDGIYDPRASPRGSRFSGNVGTDHAVYEQGISAGNVDNENLVEQKKTNLVTLSIHLQFRSFADRLETVVWGFHHGRYTVSFGSNQ
ncbi:hypothetical protein CCACVL1_29859, partial [Corchorus capsularis]